MMKPSRQALALCLLVLSGCGGGSASETGKSGFACLNDGTCSGGAKAIAPKDIPALTCADFTYQDEAQFYFTTFAVAALDLDKDGVACNALPKKSPS